VVAEHVLSTFAWRLKNTFDVVASAVVLATHGVGRNYTDPIVLELMGAVNVAFVLSLVASAVYPMAVQIHRYRKRLALVRKGKLRELYRLITESDTEEVEDVESVPRHE
jgi:hypothetical protein